MNESELRVEIEAYRLSVNPARLALLENYGAPQVFTRAYGVWLEDPSGQKFMDFVSGYGAATLGHKHPVVMAALQDAIASELPFNYPLSVPIMAGKLAGKLCAMAGSNLSKVYFGNSGAEGIEAALKFAMARTERSEFISFSEAFHGFTLGALSLIGADHFKTPFAASGVHAHQVPFGDLDAVEQCLRTNRIAGVVLEPVQGMGGARAWEADKLKQLYILCQRHGSLLILDEVLTGIGRTGKWFAFHHLDEGFHPDIVIASKGLTGGAIPMCAVLMTDEVYESVYSGIGRANIHASTFEANLIAMVAGLTVIKIIEEKNLLERVSSLAASFEKELVRLKRLNLGITDVRVSGLLMSFQVSDDLYRGEDVWGAPAFQQRLLKRGILTNIAAQMPSYINLLPPFTLSDSEREHFFFQIKEALFEASSIIL
jgi:acetylornithine/succinyldiaminopimelate/putrescine aminotransferase